MVVRIAQVFKSCFLNYTREMSKTSQTRSGGVSVEETGRGQVEKRAHEPKPDNVAALSEVYNAKS